MLKKKSKYNMSRANSKKGFTLLESLIVVFIFSLVIVTSTAVFSGIFGTQKATKNIQRNIEETRTVLDLMAKTIRMSSKAEPESAMSGNSVITLFNNSQGKCVSYKFETKRLFVAEEAESNSEECKNKSYSYTPMTSVEIENGKFFVTKTDTDAGVIGRAIITMEVSDAKLETAVSFRDYEGSVQ